MISEIAVMCNISDWISNYCHFFSSDVQMIEVSHVMHVWKLLQGNLGVSCLVWIDIFPILLIKLNHQFVERIAAFCTPPCILSACWLCVTSLSCLHLTLLRNLQWQKIGFNLYQHFVNYIVCLSNDENRGLKLHI